MYVSICNGIVIQIKEALEACRSALHSLVADETHISTEIFDSIRQSVRVELENSLRRNSFWVHLSSLLSPSSGVVTTNLSNNITQQEDLRTELFSSLNRVTIPVSIMAIETVLNKKTRIWNQFSMYIYTVWICMMYTVCMYTDDGYSIIFFQNTGYSYHAEENELLEQFAGLCWCVREQKEGLLTEKLTETQVVCMQLL
jgi:hypothetical protein